MVRAEASGASGGEWGADARGAEARRSEASGGGRGGSTSDGSGGNVSGGERRRGAPSAMAVEAILVVRQRGDGGGSEGAKPERKHHPLKAEK